jgi:hypothetical protein
VIPILFEFDSIDDKGDGAVRQPGIFGRRQPVEVGNVQEGSFRRR